MRAFAAVIALTSMVLGCDDRAGAFTLYRASPLDPTMRIHMATFDAEDGAAYNAENCRIVAQLFQSQPGVSVRYWCEAGRFKE